MKSLIQKSRLMELVQQRNSVLVLAAGSLLLNLLLVLLVFYTSGRERIILVPPVIDRNFWVSESEVSPEYLSEMTLFFSYLRLNVTPDSVDTQQKILLRYVDPRHYGPLKDQLVAERDHILQQHLSTTFYPVNVEVDTGALNATITGDLISSAGTTVLAPVRVAYAIHYRYDNGRLLVDTFTEIAPDAKTH